MPTPADSPVLPDDRGGNSFVVRGISLVCRSGLGEMADPVKSLTQAAFYLFMPGGWNIRNCYLYGHPRAGIAIGHYEGAVVAALPGAVPHQAACAIVGNEPAPEVIVVTM